ncbi:MAG: VWA domain-containing protein [Chloroflexota bacterium]|jgi:Ca-activated chloride channel family protein
MKQIFSQAFFAFLLMATSACSVLRQPVTKPSSGDVVLTVVANSSLQPWLDKATLAFNTDRVQTGGRRNLFAQVRYVEAGQAVADMATSTPSLWLPDSEAWVDVAAARKVAGFAANTCVSTARSPLVIAMWRDVAEALGYPGRTLGWLDMSSLTGDASAWAYYSGGQFGRILRMAHPHPGISGAGAGALLAVMQSAKANAQPISPADAQLPILQASVSAFESGIALFANSSEALGKTMRERGVGFLGAAVLYESTVAQLNQAATSQSTNNKSSNQPDLIAVYPFEGTVMATHPACLNSSASAEQQEAARVFRDYLLKDTAQKWAAEAGLRPVNAAVKAEARAGIDLNQPKTIFERPAVGGLEALQGVWQASKKPINLVMVLDTSGSMSGAKIEGLRSAAATFVGQMNNDDQISIVSFATDIKVLLQGQKVGTARANAISAVKALPASGNTMLYDAIGAGAGVISKTKSSQRTNVLVVLTDGLDTGSKSFKFDNNLIATASQNSTTVWTIAYGNDADKDKLSQLARQSNGSFYLGSEANITAIYQEMSTAFGGSGGIGR